MNALRSFAMWLVWHVPIGRLAPRLMGFALGASGKRVPELESGDSEP